MTAPVFLSQKTISSHIHNVRVLNIILVTVPRAGDLFMCYSYIFLDLYQDSSVFYWILLWFSQRLYLHEKSCHAIFTNTNFFKKEFFNTH